MTEEQVMFGTNSIKQKDFDVWLADAVLRVGRFRVTRVQEFWREVCAMRHTRACYYFAIELIGIVSKYRQVFNAMIF